MNLPVCQGSASAACLLTYVLSKGRFISSFWDPGKASEYEKNDMIVPAGYSCTPRTAHRFLLDDPSYFKADRFIPNLL